MLARLGLQELVVTNPLVNFIPSLASRSRFGVRTPAFPYAPQSSHDISSAITRIKFGRNSAATSGNAANAIAPSKRLRIFTSALIREIDDWANSNATASTLL